MASYDVRIITASYRREPRNGPEPAQLPVIQLFGRTRDGQSITIEHSGFQPYFFVVEAPQSLRGAFGRDPQVVKLEDVTLQVEGKPTPCARVILRQPWKTPEYREKARRYGSTPLEADIPFQHRFIYDMDLGAAVRVHGTEASPAGKYTTDLFLIADRFEPCDPFRPALRVLSFDIENSIQDGHIFCIGIAYREEWDSKAPARARLLGLLPPRRAVLARRRPHPHGRLVGRAGGAPEPAHEAGDARLRRPPAFGGRKTRALAATHRRRMGERPREGHPLLPERRRSLAPHPREDRPHREDPGSGGREQAPARGRAPRAHVEPDRLDPDPRRRPRPCRGPDDENARRPRRADRRRIRAQPAAWVVRMGHLARLPSDVSVPDHREQHLLHDRLARGDDREPDGGEVPLRRREERPPPGHPREPDEGPPGRENENARGDGPRDARVLRRPAGGDQGPDERVLRRPRVLVLSVQRPEGRRLDHRVRKGTDQGHHRRTRGRRREGGVRGHGLRVLPVACGRVGALPRVCPQARGAVLARPNEHGSGQGLSEPVQPRTQEAVRRKGRLAHGRRDRRPRVRDPPDGRVRPPERGAAPRLR